MNSVLAAREEAMLKPLRRHFEARGYAFFEHPTRELVPPFLGTYRPDAIAYDGSGGGVVIEVKATPHSPSSEALSKVTTLFDGQDAWRLQVIYGSSHSEQEAELGLPSIASLRKALTELQALRAGGHHPAALLFGWSLLEAAARLLDGDRHGAASPGEAIERLTSQGLLGQAVSAQLRDLLSLRHAVAHGDLTRAVGASETSVVAQAVTDLLSQLDVDADMPSSLTPPAG